MLLRLAKRLSVLAVLILPFSGCNCADTYDYGWELRANDTLVTDSGADISSDTSPDIRPVDVRDVTDTFVPVDVSDTLPDIDTWRPDEVEPEVCEEAKNDRTSIVVDDKGTMWLGYHKYRGQGCRNSTLVVAHRRVAGRWVREDIQPHEGIFAVSTIDTNRPIAVYPDAAQGTFKAAHREGFRRWRFHDFDVGAHRVDRRDGFDVTEDGEQFFVTFAEDEAPKVRLYSYDTTAGNPQWKSRAPLRVRDPQAAMERGLRADPDDSVYLVHHSRDRLRFGIARYDKQDDRWPEKSYFSDDNSAANVHSFVITDDFNLCMSSRLSERLLVTCGTMFNLQMKRKLFPNERIPSDFPSSMVEGRDGTLYVVFNPEDNSELRVAKRHPDGHWSVRTVFNGSSYGISTAIDKTGDLVMAFYTCGRFGRGSCSLKVIQERPDGL